MPSSRPPSEARAVNLAHLARPAPRHRRRGPGPGQMFRGTAWRSRCSAEPRGDQDVPRNRVAIKMFRGTAWRSRSGVRRSPACAFQPSPAGPRAARSGSVRDRSASSRRSAALCTARAAPPGHRQPGALQGVRQHLLRYPGHAAVQLAEPQLARSRLGEQLDDHRDPLGPDPVEQSARRAAGGERVSAGSGHREFRWMPWPSGRGGIRLPAPAEWGRGRRFAVR